MPIPDVAGLFASLLPSGRRGAVPTNVSLENPSVNLNDPATWDALGHSPTDAGITVGPEDALRFGPVWQCLEILSSDMASATMHCHKNEVEPGESDIDLNQPAERVCSLEWNEITPACEGWGNLVFHHKLFGSGYAYIAREGGSKNGRILWMANLVPSSVTPMFDKELGFFYEYMLDGVRHFLNPHEVFHLKGMAFQPNRPINLFEKMRNELGLALSSKKWLGKFFERGGHHGGILTLPPAMKPEARSNLEKGVADRASPTNWFKTLVLRDGAGWQSATVDPRTAQMSELTEDEARAVCHFMNMPPSKIGLPGSVSYNSQEQSQLQYVTGPLLHIATRMHGEAQMKLLSDRTRRARSHRFEHSWTKLLEPDIKTLNEVLEIQRRNEIIHANDWRKKINLPQRTDAKAEQYINPNTKSKNSSQNGDGVDDEMDETDDSTATNRVSRNMQPIVDEAVMRAGRRLVTLAKNFSRKPGTITEWIDSGLREHGSIVDEELTTTLTCCVPEKAAQMKPQIRSWMLCELQAAIAPYLQPPHSANDLEKNVQTVTDKWLGSLIENFNLAFHGHDTRTSQCH